MLGRAKPLINRVGNALLSPPRTVFGAYTNHGPRERRQVALTFDDGPSDPSTGYLLDVLDRHDVKATFFCVGSMVRDHPHLVRRAFDAGHVIANHSMHHSRRAATALRGAAHIDESSTIIGGVVGAAPSLYRPPWGWLTPWEARRVHARRMAAIGWDVYPDDWMVPEVPGEVLAEQVLAEVQPGSIVLMHDGRAVYPDCAKTNTAAAVDLIIERLRADGYELVTVPQMLAVTAYAA